MPLGPAGKGCVRDHQGEVVGRVQAFGMKLHPDGVLRSGFTGDACRDTIYRVF